MNKYVVAFLIACTGCHIPETVGAEDDIYKRGHDQAYTAGCTDPTAREDGTALASSEIDRIEYMIDPDPTELANPLYTFVMVGGCTATLVDLQQFPVNVTLHKYAITVDTQGLVSAPSVSRTFRIQSANPNAPGQIR